MALWWIGNLIFLVVVIPVVVLLLKGLEKPALEIKTQTEVVRGRAGAITSDLNAVGGLLKTRALVKQVGAGMLRYGAALDRIL